MNGRDTHGRPYRLPAFDYGAGCYFVTVCTRDRLPILSRIPQGAPVGRPDLRPAPYPSLTPVGAVLDRTIRGLPEHNRDITLDHYVIMPNHFHLLLTVAKPAGLGSGRPTRLTEVIRTLKSLVTRELGRSVFQSSFHDHVIRDEADYLLHWQYIDSNPAHWAEDEYFVV